MYASDQATYDAALDGVTDASQIAELLPTAEVELDVRGSVDVMELAKFCSIECGVIESSPSTQRQLVLHCRLLRWAVQTLVPRVDTFVLIGRIFAPRASFKQAGHELSDYVEDVSIYKHPI